MHLSFLFKVETGGRELNISLQEYVHLFVYSIFEFCVIPVLLKPV